MGQTKILGKNQSPDRLNTLHHHHLDHDIQYLHTVLHLSFHFHSPGQWTTVWLVQLGELWSSRCLNKIRGASQLESLKSDDQSRGKTAVRLAATVEHCFIQSKQRAFISSLVVWSNDTKPRGSSAVWIEMCEMIQEKYPHSCQFQKTAILAMVPRGHLHGLIFSPLCSLCLSQRIAVGTSAPTHSQADFCGFYCMFIVISSHEKWAITRFLWSHFFAVCRHFVYATENYWNCRFTCVCVCVYTENVFTFWREWEYLCS